MQHTIKSPTLQLYMTLPRTRTLGPGERFAIWVQRCPFRCPGCMAQGALAAAGGKPVSVTALAAAILAEPGIEGLTLSGGEPFAQAGTLADLVGCVRQERDLGVIVYSGYTLARLRRKATREKGVARLLACTDLLVDGKYVERLDDGLSLRGSSNQRRHLLTQRYAESAPRYYSQPRREVEIAPMGDEVAIVGIPGKEALRLWRDKFPVNQKS